MLSMPSHSANSKKRKPSDSSAYQPPQPKKRSKPSQTQKQSAIKPNLVERNSSLLAAGFHGSGSVCAECGDAVHPHQPMIICYTCVSRIHSTCLSQTDLSLQRFICSKCQPRAAAAGSSGSKTKFEADHGESRVPFLQSTAQKQTSTNSKSKSSEPGSSSSSHKKRPSNRHKSQSSSASLSNKHRQIELENNTNQKTKLDALVDESTSLLLLAQDDDDICPVCDGDCSCAKPSASIPTPSASNHHDKDAEKNRKSLNQIVDKKMHAVVDTDHPVIDFFAQTLNASTATTPSSCDALLTDSATKSVDAFPRTQKDDPSGSADASAFNVVFDDDMCDEVLDHLSSTDTSFNLPKTTVNENDETDTDSAESDSTDDDDLEVYEEPDDTDTQSNSASICANARSIIAVSASRTLLSDISDDDDIDDHDILQTFTDDDDTDTDDDDMIMELVHDRLLLGWSSDDDGDQSDSYSYSGSESDDDGCDADRTAKVLEQLFRVPEIRNAVNEATDPFATNNNKINAEIKNENEVDTNTCVTHFSSETKNESKRAQTDAPSTSSSLSSASVVGTGFGVASRRKIRSSSSSRSTKLLAPPAAQTSNTVGDATTSNAAAAAAAATPWLAALAAIRSSASSQSIGSAASTTELTTELNSNAFSAAIAAAAAAVATTSNRSRSLSTSATSSDEPSDAVTAAATAMGLPPQVAALASLILKGGLIDTNASSTQNAHENGHVSSKPKSKSTYATSPNSKRSRSNSISHAGLPHRSWLATETVQSSRPINVLVLEDIIDSDQLMSDDDDTHGDDDDALSNGRRTHRAHARRQRSATVSNSAASLDMDSASGSDLDLDRWKRIPITSYWKAQSHRVRRRRFGGYHSHFESNPTFSSHLGGRSARMSGAGRPVRDGSMRHGMPWTTKFSPNVRSSALNTTLFDRRAFSTQSTFVGNANNAVCRFHALHDDEALPSTTGTFMASPILIPNMGHVEHQPSPLLSVLRPFEELTPDLLLPPPYGL